MKIRQKQEWRRTTRIRADSASNRSILPDNGSPTAPATFIASRAWRHPIMPGTELKCSKIPDYQNHYRYQNLGTQKVIFQNN